MANFKCETCRTRVWRDGDPAQLPSAPCPECGRPLEPVRSPAELAGLRTVRPRTRHDSQRVGDEIRATFARHAAGRGGS